MPIIRISDCVPLPIVVCPVVAVVMLESRVARCVHCVENVACYAGNILHTVHTDTLKVTRDKTVQRDDRRGPDIRDHNLFENITNQ